MSYAEKFDLDAPTPKGGLFKKMFANGSLNGKKKAAFKELRQLQQTSVTAVVCLYLHNKSTALV